MVKPMSWRFREGGIGITLLLLSSCGFRTPDLHSPLETKQDVQISINHIVNRVKCELIQGIIKTLDDDKKIASQNGFAPKLTWLEKWSAKVTLTLIAEENTSFNPGFSVFNNNHSSVQRFSNGSVVTTPRALTLGLGGGFSSNATRTNKLDFFFAFEDFINSDDTNKDYSIPCEQFGSFLESDLKLGEWIEEATFANYTDSIKTPKKFTFPQSVISHQVNFVVRASGNLSPGFRLARVTFNQGSIPFFQTLRNKTNDILITLGPTAAAEAVPIKPKTTQAQPSQALINSHLASEIGRAVAAAIKSNQ